MKIFQVSTPTSSKLFSLYFIIRNMPVSLWVSYAFECFIDVRPIQAPQNIKCVFSFSAPECFRTICFESILSTSWTCLLVRFRFTVTHLSPFLFGFLNRYLSFQSNMIQLIILDFCLLVKTALQNRRKKKVNYYFKDYRHRSIVHVNKCRCPIFHDAIKKVSKSMWFCFNYYKTLHSIELNGIQERYDLQQFCLNKELNRNGVRNQGGF